MQFSPVSVGALSQRLGTRAAGFLVALSQHLQLLPGNCVVLFSIYNPTSRAGGAGPGPALKEISLPDPRGRRQALYTHLGCVSPAALAVLWPSPVVESVGAALGPTTGAILGSLGWCSSHPQ